MTPIDKAIKALEPFARAASAIGDDLGPVRFYTDTGYREMPLEDLQRARSVYTDLSSARLEDGDVELARRIISERWMHAFEHPPERHPKIAEFNARIDRILAYLGQGGER